MAKKPSVILKQAAERIRFGRWMQGDFFDRDKLDAGRSVDEVKVCALGAMDWASEIKCWAHPNIQWTRKRREAWQRARDYMRAEVEPLGFYGGIIGTFNDTPGRTMTEVRQALLRASATAAENGE